MKKPLKPAAKQPTAPKLTTAQKAAKVRAARTKFNKADAAYDKAQKAYSQAKQELDAALAAL